MQLRAEQLSLSNTATEARLEPRLALSSNNAQQTWPAQLPQTTQQLATERGSGEQTAEKFDYYPAETALVHKSMSSREQIQLADIILFMRWQLANAGNTHTHTHTPCAEGVLKLDNFVCAVCTYILCVCGLCVAGCRTKSMTTTSRKVINFAMAAWHVEIKWWILAQNTPQQAHTHAHKHTHTLTRQCTHLGRLGLVWPGHINCKVAEA